MIWHKKYYTEKNIDEKTDKIKLDINVYIMGHR